MRTSAQGTAYAFVQLTNGHAREVVDTLKTLPSVESVEALQGPYQLVVRMGRNAATALHEVDGVARVVTLAPATPGGHPGSRATPEPRKRVGFRIPQPCTTPA